MDCLLAAPGAERRFAPILFEALAPVLAATGIAEVGSALGGALVICGEASKPVLVELHFWGQAGAVLGNANDGIRHFKCATEIDPVGNYGRLPGWWGG